MPALDRRIGLRGPRFYEADEGEGLRLLFVLYLDGGTRIGPQAATKEDTLEHGDAWAEFVARTEAEERAARARAEAVTSERPIDLAAVDLSDFDPFRAMVTFVDPPEGRPEREPTEREKKRAAAAAAGREA